MFKDSEKLFHLPSTETAFEQEEQPSSKCEILKVRVLNALVIDG